MMRTDNASGVGAHVTQSYVRELLVDDHTRVCPYLPDQIARMPLRWPTAMLDGSQLDERLAAGDRRSGRYLYRTQCPTCRACEPLRLDVDRFEPNQTQRRVKRRGDRELTADLRVPIVDDQRVALFNLHRRDRGLTVREGHITADEYREFLVDTCCDSVEIDYRLGDQLIGVAVADVGQLALSAVYCYYDTRFSHLSLGVYSILKQVEICQQRRLRHLYLGLYIGPSPHMSYKARYLPHERLIDQEWRLFDRV